MNTIRNEYVAHLVLAHTAQTRAAFVQAWQAIKPAPVRTVRRRTFGVLAIAQRHPQLFSFLTR